MTVHTEPFWAGIAAGELLIQRCEACGKSVFYPRLACPHCHARDLTWVKRDPHGTLVTYTTVHRARPSFEAWAPYHVGIGDFDGARLFGVIDGSPQIGAGIELIPTAEASAAVAEMPTPYVFTPTTEE